MDLVLEHGDIICINGDARNMEVSCATGRLWVTQQGDPNDYILAPGDRLVINRNGRIAVTAMNHARLHLVKPMKLKGAGLALLPAT